MEAPATVSTPEYEPPVIRQRRVRKNPREAVTLDAHRQHCDCSSESQCLATCGPPCVVEISRSPLAEYADCEPPQPVGRPGDVDATKRAQQEASLLWNVDFSK